MKIAPGLLLLLLAGCAASVPPPPPPPPVVVIEPPPPPASKAPVRAVVRAYQQARTKELPAILKPDATADYIADVNRKEIQARKAVRLLESQDGQRTPKALTAAREAVRQLEDALNAAIPDTKDQSP